MTVFGRYARYYDALYGDKDYGAEAAALDNLIIAELGPGPWRLLDAGCGTGMHAVEFAGRGYAVTALDRSADMLAVARTRTDAVQWLLGDLVSLHVDGTFDVITCLFAALGYQLTSASVLAALRGFRSHLRMGGMLAFDVWHAPAVFSVWPSRKVKVAKADGLTIERVAEPRGVDAVRRTNTTRYTVTVHSADVEIERVVEEHTVRFFDRAEISALCRAAGFEVLWIVAGWGATDPPAPTDWTMAILARAN